MKILKNSIPFLITFLFFFMKSQAQSVNNYETDWKAVTNQIDRGQPQSALELVKKIYAKAKTDKQEAQIVKALIYMNQLQQENRENNELLSISELEKEIATSNEPAASLLKSYVAGLYQNYFNHYRYQLYNRTNTATSEKADPATWTIDDFTRQISRLYLQSLQNKQLLQHTSPETYDALIEKGNVRYLRPTLYDLLAFRALDYFGNPERSVTQPVYQFEISQPAAFAPAASFVRAAFETKDSLSFLFKALQVYQDLLQFHLNDQQPDALIDADLNRLQFVYSHSTSQDKDSLYYAALEDIANKYTTRPAAAQAWFLMAQWQYNQGNLPNNQKNPDDRHIVKAKELLEKISNAKEKSEGSVNAGNLLQQLLRPELGFQVEKVNIPSVPFRILVTYKNTPVVYLRIIKATKELKNALTDLNDNQKNWSLLTTAQPLNAWQQALPAAADYRQHRTEIKAEGLPAGEYYVLASLNKDFNQSDNLLAAQLTYISDISYVNNKNDFFVLGRNSGHPLPHATVILWNKIYNYTTRKYTNTKVAELITDQNGHFTLKSGKTQSASKIGSGSNYLPEITYNNDHLFIDDQNNGYYYYNDYADTDKEKSDQVFFFTDRSLYRPGQTVYFKGIAVSYDPLLKKSGILAGFKTTVTLYDANHQKVSDTTLTTNEFGSFNGTFRLPENGLNGDFSIAASNGSCSFKMEEYKRPKFYVDFEKMKGAYQLNEDVTITGFAKAYAGNNVENARVTYRVVRQARFPYPWIFARYWWPANQQQTEITQGETTTDAEGKFRIRFTAAPDRSIDPQMEPVFSYRVYADVTDMNGEVRSGENSIAVGYKSLLIKADIPERLLSDQLQKLNIHTQNMEGNFEKATINVVLTKLEPEQRLLRSRYWEQPDQFVLSKEEYIKYFPNDIYKNENEPASWPKKQQVLSQSGATDSTGIFTLSNAAIAPGYYAVEISAKDKEGKTVTDIHYTEIYQQTQIQPSYPQYLWTKAPAPIEPGEKTGIEIGSSATDVFLVQSISKDKTSYTFAILNNHIKKTELGATEADRGGYGTGFLFVKNNRVYTGNYVIDVPWTNKELQLKYETFRDKTEPGSEEKWNIRISGYKSDKVAAEMLASMYDASLDQFYTHQWEVPRLWPGYYANNTWITGTNFTTIYDFQNSWFRDEHQDFEKRYDQLIFPNPLNRQYHIFYGAAVARNEASGTVAGRGLQRKAAMDAAPAPKLESLAFTPPQLITENKDTLPEQQEAITQEVSLRKNFNETAFFFPDLRTDEKGNIRFSFTMPEALTRWKFQSLVHTKKLAFGYSSKEIVTQKELMVQPNIPRFLREGDKLELSTKIVNLSSKEVTGIATLQLFDAETNEPIDGWFRNVIPQQYFTIAAGQSGAIRFPVEVPFQFSKVVTWRIVAKVADSSGTTALSDGEENMLPVLTNRMLVTESLPLQLRGAGSKKFSFDQLLKSGNSETLTTQALTVEYTSNPAWYAVQALPYMMEYPYECAEQTWNRYYANSLATLIANRSPKIKEVFDNWKTADTSTFTSNLQKNQELKAALLEETPWVLQAQTETQQKKNMSLLFDLVRMSRELNSAYDKLSQLQSPNGGFVWFKGGSDDRYMTQYIVTGIGHLKKINGIEQAQTQKINSMINKAVPYLDARIKETYDELIRNKVSLTTYTPSYYEIQYLYMRSFFKELKIAPGAQKAVAYFTGRAAKTWTKTNKYMQAMTALALHRGGDAVIPKAILKSLRETAINSEELGMYYKDAASSWWWYEAPIERQALIIEAFEEITKDKKTADDLRTWLLKNKQTNNWKSTKATAEACYALLLQETQWLSATPGVSVDLGGLKVEAATEHTEAGTGYLKKTIPGEKVRPAMGNITLSVTNPRSGGKNNSSPSWGSVYWQYLEDQDKITFAETPLQLHKKLFVETNSDRGPVLTPVTEGSAVKVGDKIKVRIELRADRDMEYVHMKDMRASGFEPVNVLSSYKWQGGLGYYETTKDASTNFFFGYLPKGTYVFEYSLFATVAGNFSNGITSIQCMYAPEFTAHSEGVRVTIDR